MGNLTDSCESWAYRNGLLPQLAKLEWQRRKVVLGRTGERLRTFAPQPLPVNALLSQVRQKGCEP